MVKRILLVEDEHVSRVLMVDLLEKMLGQAVVTAKDGIEAIHVASEERPDLILMDLDLPRLSGWEAARSLKEHEFFRNTPILAVSAQTMAGDRERALQAGFDGFFAKPIEVDAFVDFLRPYLGEEVE
jgi:two-component system cell cycle response regulator DivK